MQQFPIFQDEPTISTFQRRLIASFSSLVLALAQGLLMYWGLSYFSLSIPMLLLSIALLYFVTPIPLSALLAYQARYAPAGREASGGIGCAGALLAVLFTSIYLYTNTGPSNNFFGGWGFLIFISSIVLSFIGVFIALFGAYVGSIVGAKLRKRR